MVAKPIWAPWRIDYIRSEKPDGCPLCQLPQSADDQSANILLRGKTCYVVLNLYPYNNGHLMVAPYRHVPDYTSLGAEELAESSAFIQKCMIALKETMSAEGFNIGINQGKVAGAGIEEHVHIHVVPRWNGDYNFMPVIGQTKVIPQHLRDTYDILKPKFE